MEKSQIRHYLIFLVVAEFEIVEELTPLPSYRGIHTLASSFWILTEFVVIWILSDRNTAQQVVTFLSMVLKVFNLAKVVEE